MAASQGGGGNSSPGRSGAGLPSVEPARTRGSLGLPDEGAEVQALTGKVETG